MTSTRLHRYRWLSAAGLCLALAACSSQPREDYRDVTTSTYDKATGRLKLLTVDRNRDGRPDVWNHMDGATLVMSELDTDYDGLKDRWEWYEGTKVVKLGMSKRRNGVCDSWSYPDAEGRLGRSEDDGNGDGRPDKWEVYAGNGIQSSEFDDNFDGTPDRRWTYGPGGTVVLAESEPDGKGGYRQRVSH